MNRIVYFILIISLISCKKAGLGGDNTITVFLQHHGKTIPNQNDYHDTIFVKYDAVELPGTNLKDFDRIFVGESGEDHVHIRGLQIGKYYFYAAGWDTSISQRVTGGFGIELKDLTADTNLNLPVIE